MADAPDFLTLDGLAQEFGLNKDHIRKKLLPRWEAQGFPCPLPWSKHRRYNREAVLRWKRAQERAANARLS